MIIEPLVLAAPGSGDGGRIGGAPPARKVTSTLEGLLPTRVPAVPGAGSWGWYRAGRGDLPAHPPSLPRIPAGGPGMLSATPPASCQQNGSAFARCVKKPLQSRSQPR